MTEQAVGMDASIAVLKQSRYFPPVLYQHQNFEMFYIYSGQCTHVCKGQEYEPQQGDFCLLEYGAPHRIINNSDDCIIIELLDQICASLLSGDSVLSRFLRNALFVILLRSFHPQQEQPVALENSPISAIAEYIYAHEQDITLTALAEAFGYSVPHMSKLISSNCGLSFSDIIRQIRMRRATWLLKNTTLTITQIAAEIHCTDTSHFGRSFRK